MTDANVTSSPPGPQPQTHGRFRTIISFFGWVFTGFGLFRKHRGAEEILVCEVNKGFFLWASILVGFVGSAITRHYPGAGAFFGWLWAVVLVYTIFTLIADINFWKFVSWAV